MNRFGKNSSRDIDEAIDNLKPLNTTKTENYIWKQFQEFCEQRNYELTAWTSNDELGNILKDWAFNMKRKDGSDYKEGVVKTIWNVNAKLLQEQYFKNHNRKIDPFKDLAFEGARKARSTKRKQLQLIPEKRKASSAALTRDEILKIIQNFDENTPDGLQKKFYQIAAVELAWRGNEAASCVVNFFKKELNNYGLPTGRLEYNTIFGKTAQGGDKNLVDSKWLTPIKENEDLCPVRLYEKMMFKRTPNIKTNRLFLTPNNNWKTTNVWCKNCPVGVNQISKWTRLGAENVGIDTKKARITNHSNRSSAVSVLANAGANLQEIIKVTGHSTPNSLKPYLKLNEQHHTKIINQIRNNQNVSSSSVPSTSSLQQQEPLNTNNIYYNNCIFHFHNN